MNNKFPSIVQNMFAATNADEFQSAVKNFDKHMLTTRQANEIYDVLVKLARANESLRENFVWWFVTCDHYYSKEYRFQGNLGFGGKFWVNAGRYYVTCYPEDETPDRLTTIESVNAALASLSSKGRDR